MVDDIQIIVYCRVNVQFTVKNDYDISVKELANL